jgi:beta-glucosidase-like glycosyl hydrolase
MICLSSSYLFNFKKVYPDLILAGNDIILDTHKFSNYRQIKKRINYLSKKAEKNPELMERINESAKKVLEKKGYKIL